MAVFERTNAKDTELQPGAVQGDPSINGLGRWRAHLLYLQICECCVSLQTQSSYTLMTALPTWWSRVQVRKQPAARVPLVFLRPCPSLEKGCFSSSVTDPPRIRKKSHPCQIDPQRYLAAHLFSLCPPTFDSSAVCQGTDTSRQMVPMTNVLARYRNRNYCLT